MFEASGLGLRVLRAVLQSSSAARTSWSLTGTRWSLVPDGRLLARAKQFEEDLLFVDLHPEEALIRRLHDPRPRKENPDTPIEVTPVPGYEPREGSRETPRSPAPKNYSPKKARCSARWSWGLGGSTGKERLLAGGARSVSSGYRLRARGGGRRPGSRPRERDRRSYAEPATPQRGATPTPRC